MRRETSALPTGTVTFVFTDIEGSTGLLGRLGDRYAELLEGHHRVLREAFGARGGVEVSTEGDSFFVVFPGPRDAVAAAVEAQRALLATEWPEGERVLVRMGVHTGEAVLGGDNYTGVDVHRAARIGAAGHGGQILVSAATRALIEQAPPEGVELRDLGSHRLKDLPTEERLSQIVAEGLPADFPGLRSLDMRTNLPPQLTTFVGRRRELDEVKDAVGRSRLVTLTGPGGTGKTRLAIEAAGELAAGFPDGVCFVALGPVTDPSMVSPAVADALDLREAGGKPPLEAVTEHLRDRELLLVLDNFEQVLEAAGDVGQLLTGSERVRALVTSREALGLHGEREYPVPPLSQPDPERLPSLEGLGQYESVALFIERAAAVKPGFAVTNENAPAVAEICSRLDGLPLAIELAAARVRILSPLDILRRLKNRLAFLSGGGRDRPTRQQTLRDAITWSYELLEDDDRTMFVRLAAFVGGFDLDAAEAVAAPGIDAFGGVSSLAAKSLVRQVETEAGGSRFLMLETIREFAAERLGEDPDADEVHRRHVAHFRGLAEGAAPRLFGEEQARWLDALAADHDNLRAAIGWAEAHGDVEGALRVAAALWRFWQMRGHMRDGRGTLERLLALPAEADPAVRAAALEGAGGLAYWMADLAGAERHYSECLELRRSLGDTAKIAEALYNLAFAYGMRTGGEQDLDRALALVEESLEHFRALGDEQGQAKALWGLGDMLYEAGRLEEAEPPLEESLAMHRRLGNRFDEAWALFILALDRQKLGRVPEAEEGLRASLEILAGAGDASGVPLILGALASIAADDGDWERAVRLAAAAAAQERVTGGGLTGWNEQVEGWEERRRSLVDDETYARLWALGEAMSLEEAVAYALEATSGDR